MFGLGGLLGLGFCQGHGEEHLRQLANIQRFTPDATYTKVSLRSTSEWVLVLDLSVGHVVPPFSWLVLFTV